MTVYGVVLIAFLISLFIGSSKVCIGLGIVMIIFSISQLLHAIGWLD